MRLGTYYRALTLDKLGIQANQECVLDIGGFDGYWLSQQQAETKVCVDINPKVKYKNVAYIMADALALPFKDECFRQVFAFEIIEHVRGDECLIKEMYRVSKLNGEIVISTPHKNITIFPPFLTNWVSRKWGHRRVKGYLETEIRDIVPKDAYIEFLNLKAPSYRFFYFFLRFLWGISQKIAKLFVKVSVHLDTMFLNGEGGYILAKVRKI